MGCGKHYVGSVPAKDSSVQWHLTIFQLLFSSRQCAREDAEEGNNLTSISLGQCYFFLLVPMVNWEEGGTIWSGMEWVSWGQCGQAYLLFLMMLFSCIACSASSLHGDRLCSPALMLTRHLWYWNSTQRISTEQSECKSSFCMNSTSRLT